MDTAQQALVTLHVAQLIHSLGDVDTTTAFDAVKATLTLLERNPSREPPHEEVAAPEQIFIHHGLVAIFQTFKETNISSVVSAISIALNAVKAFARTAASQFPTSKTDEDDKKDDPPSPLLPKDSLFSIRTGHSIVHESTLVRDFALVPLPKPFDSQSTFLSVGSKSSAQASTTPSREETSTPASTPPNAGHPSTPLRSRPSKLSKFFRKFSASQPRRRHTTPTPAPRVFSNSTFFGLPLPGDQIPYVAPRLHPDSARRAHSGLPSLKETILASRIDQFLQRVHNLGLRAQELGLVRL